MTNNVPILPATTTTDNGTVDAAVAVLPVGSCEQHGPYLPLVTDTLIAIAIADAIAGQHPNVFQLPAITYSCSHEHAAFPGTIRISATTLSAVIADIAEWLAHQGITALIIVNAHGGNAVLTNVAQQANAHGPLRVGLYPSREDWAETRVAAGIISSSHDDMHAGELETSVLLAAFPDYVREGWNAADHSAPDPRYLTTLGISAYTHTGVIGQPSQATQEKGMGSLSLVTSAPPSGLWSVCSQRHTTKTCAVMAPVRWRSRPPPRTEKPATSQPSTFLERRCENFLYCYQGAKRRRSTILPSTRARARLGAR